MPRLYCRYKNRMGINTINKVPERINWQTNSLHVYSKCVHPGENFPFITDKEEFQKYTPKTFQNKMDRINKKHL